MTIDQKKLLLEKLEKIAEPEAAYNRDMEIYLDRLVQTCIGLAKNVLK
jgi:hypothetical protein